MVVSPVNKISQIQNIHIFGKMETIQKGGSVKLRGAYNKIYKVLERARYMGHQSPVKIVTASMGNHALACHEAIKRLKMVKKFD